jgi:hypothetical protein
LVVSLELGKRDEQTPLTECELTDSGGDDRHLKTKTATMEGRDGDGDGGVWRQGITCLRVAQLIELVGL